jgi:hypothetical protein
MKNKKNYPNILDSKTKKVLIELPQYTFYHSTSSSRARDFFLGRKSLLARLKSLLVDTTSKTGVYLVTGNKGVGKSSLVDKVIDETSLNNFQVSVSIKYLLAILVFVLFTQYTTNHWEKVSNVFLQDHKCWIKIAGRIVAWVSFLMMGAYSFFREIIQTCTNKKQPDFFSHPLDWFDVTLHKKLPKGFWFVWHLFKSAVNELYSPSYSSVSQQKHLYIYKAVFIVLSLYFAGLGFNMPMLKLFVIYLVWIFSNWLFLSLDDFLIKQYKKHLSYNKHLERNADIYKLTRGSVGGWLLPHYLFPIMCSLITFFAFYELKNPTLWMLLLVFVIFYFWRIGFWIWKTSTRRSVEKIWVIIKWTIYSSTIEQLFNFIRDYFQNCSRIFLKINFGHDDALSEKNILRLVARTLATEYKSFCKSYKHTLIWRVTALLFIGLFTSLIYNKIYIELIYKEIIMPYYWNNQPYFYSSSFIQHREWIEKLLEIPDLIWTYIAATPEYFWNSKAIIHAKSINYIWCLIFGVTWFLGWLLMRTGLFTTHHSVRKQIKRLNEAITWQIETTSGINMNVDPKGGLFKMGGAHSIKKSRMYADEREIEKELQDIFQRIRQIPTIMHKPEFVIVFDELDKVAPNSDTRENIMSINASRDRQNTILTILSNLKYFLTTVHAKFIFIAGREMYDMYLADFADRNNLMGSIFNEVVFVPSFLSDDSFKDHQNMTALVETYVCRYLMIEPYGVDAYNLRNYRKYLEIMIYRYTDNTKERNMRIQKIIAILQQFIIYLAHISKGSPKKMMQIFESFIERPDKAMVSDKERLCVRYHENSNFFLVFGYYDQFAVGLTSYLVSPVIYRFTDSNIQEHSDKLLVSSLNFIDFLMKFYNNSFSWNNIDINPEMVEINKAPELKSVATELLNALRAIHIEKSLMGLYEYRFNNLISQEIAFMTKMHEGFSAVFNFSLDESLALKDFYLNMLHGSKPQKGDDSKKKSSMSSDLDECSAAILRLVIGDLHINDDQPEEASFFFQKAADSFRTLLENKWDENTLYHYIRAMLKLGYAFERRKMNNHADLIYNTITSTLKDLKPTPIPSLERLKLLYLTHIVRFQIIEKSRIGGITLHDIEQIEDDIQNIILITGLEDGSRENSKAIIEADFYMRIGDILYYKNFNNNPTCHKQFPSPCEACRFYRKALNITLDLSETECSYSILKLLEIIPEKLGNAGLHRRKTHTARLLSDFGNIVFACKGNTIYTKDRIIADCPWNQQQNSSSPVCTKKFWNNIYYNNEVSVWHKYLKADSLAQLTGILSDINSLNKIEMTLLLYSFAEIIYREEQQYKNAAYQITKILQAFKHCMKAKLPDYEIINAFERTIDVLSQKAFRHIYMAYDCTNLMEIEKRKKDFDLPNIPLQNTMIDSEISRIRIVAMELKLKIDTRYKYIYGQRQLKAYYSRYIASPFSINYSVTGRIYRLRLKAILNWKTLMLMKREALGQAIAYQQNSTKKDALRQTVQDASTMYHYYLEILAILNCTYDDNMETRLLFNDFFEKEEKDKRTYGQACFELLLADSIFCLKEIIRLSKTTGTSYLFNHSFSATMFHDLSDWIIRHEAYNRLKKEFKEPSDNDIKRALDVINPNADKDKIVKSSRIDDLLDDFLGSEWKEQSSGYANVHNALFEYINAKETHSGGRAYHNLIDSMYYIKGDFNDRSNHFSIAMERFMINYGIIDRHIDRLNNMYKESGLYKLDNYFETLTPATTSSINN